MGNSLTEQLKDVVADMLDYYGLNAKVDQKFLGLQDVIDVAVYEEGRNDPGTAIFIMPENERAKFIGKVSRAKGIKNIIILGQAPSDVLKIKLHGDIIRMNLPDESNTEFESYLKSMASKKPDFPYFSTVSRKALEIEAKPTYMQKFEALVADQGLDLKSAQSVIYRTAISGLNIHYGRYIQLDDGNNPIFERNRDLSRETILLKAAGYLKEERLPDRGLGLESDGNSFLVLSEDEETAKVAQEIVDDYVFKNRHTIRKIMGQYPDMFNFAAVVGSLGYYAPKTMLSIERHRRTWTGIIRATVQSENSYLIEVIRTMINNVGISEQTWNRINCLISFPELNSLLEKYFEAFEKSGIGVFGFRGLKRIYIPAKRIATHMRLVELAENLDQDSLEEFCIYDSILRSNHTGFDFFTNISDLGLDEDKIALRISEMAAKGFCSKLLPHGADLPIAIYNQAKFTNFCLTRMREMSSTILDVEW